MNGPDIIAPPDANGRFGDKKIGATNRVLLILFVGSFFLPYLFGTRLRADVVVGYVFLLTIPFVQTQTHIEKQLFMISGVTFLWSFLRIATSLAFAENSEGADNYFFAIQLLTALNFPLFSMAVFLALRNWLILYRQNVLFLVLIASVLINGIAVFQWLDVDHPFNAFIFQHYGGALATATVEALETFGSDIRTNAEYLAKIAGRFSSIFGGMYVLAAFDVLIIAVSVAAISSQALTRLTSRAAAIAIGFAFLGGVLSASKTFYLGSMIALSVLTALKVINLRRLIVMMIVLLPSYFLLKSEMSDPSGESSIASVFEIVLVGDMQAVFGSRYSAEGLFDTIAAVFGNPTILMAGVGVDLGDLYLADNGYLMPLIIGGLPLALMTYGMLGLMARENYRQFRSGNTVAAGFLATHIAFLGAAIGIPTYQLPRVSLLFLILNLIFLVLRPSEVQFLSRGAARLRDWKPVEHFRSS